MIRRELAKDPKLASESWDRFLPKFRKRHLRTSEKTAKKNDKIESKTEARKAAGVEEGPSKQEKPAKKVYTPFPPAQLPRKVRLHLHQYNSIFNVPWSQIDLQLESGEYFLKAHEKEARETAKRKQKARLSLFLQARPKLNVFTASRNDCQKTRRTCGSVCCSR